MTVTAVEDRRDLAISALKPKRNKLVRRECPDHAQHLRRGAQLVFLALNLWVGFQFYRWVRYYEAGGAGAEPARPAGVEGWLPIAALMNLKAFLLTGDLPRIHPAGLFLLISFLVMSLLLRKSFCGWLCPVGTVSEYLWRAGRKLIGRNFRLPSAIDIPLRGLKYLLLGFFLYAVISMPVPAIRAFLEGPYGIVADVKMLNFFRYLSTTAAVMLAVLVLASLLVQNFWCRYLCPYGALLGLTALFSPLRIRRAPTACVDCAKCARACPSALPVDKLVTIRSAECMACLECVSVCPAQGALAMTARKRTVPAWAVAAGTVFLFLGTVAYAKLSRNWETHVPAQLYQELVPRASEFSHP